jgi:hypothetical protein
VAFPRCECFGNNASVLAKPIRGFILSKLPPPHYFTIMMANTSCNYVWLNISSLPIEEMNVGDVAIILNVTIYSKEKDNVEIFDAGQGPSVIRALLQSRIRGKEPRKLKLKIFGLDEDDEVVTSDREVDFSPSLTILRKKEIDEILCRLNRGLFSKPIHDIR